MSGLHEELENFWNEVQALVIGMIGEKYSRDDELVSRVRSKLIPLHLKYYENRLFDKIPIPRIQVIDGALSVLYTPKAISVALGDWIASESYESHWKEITDQ